MCCTRTKFESMLSHKQGKPNSLYASLQQVAPLATPQTLVIEPCPKSHVSYPYHKLSK